MIIAELSENVSGIWCGRLRDSNTGQPVGTGWFASSRSELVAMIKWWTPLSHLQFRDRMNPLDP